MVISVKFKNLEDILEFSSKNSAKDFARLNKFEIDYFVYPDVVDNIWGKFSLSPVMKELYYASRSPDYVLAYVKLVGEGNATVEDFLARSVDYTGAGHLGSAEELYNQVKEDCEEAEWYRGFGYSVTCRDIYPTFISFEKVKEFYDSFDYMPDKDPKGKRFYAFKKIKKEN